MSETTPLPPIKGTTSPRLFSNRDLAHLIVPLVIEKFLEISIGLADTLMVASVGEAAVSAVSLVDTINLLFVQFFAAIATGGAVVVAQYLGKRDQEQASHAARQLFWSSTLLSLVIMSVLLSFSRPILQFVFNAAEGEVLSHADTYFIITLLGYPFLAMYNAGAAIFRSKGYSRMSMNISVLMNLINVAGNALFIYGFGWGTAGAAASTTISRIVGSVVMVTAMLHSKWRLDVGNLWKINLNWPMIKRILRIGIPSGLENSLFQIGKVLVARLIASLGTASIAANAIVNTISSFTVVLGSAVGLASITVVGQCMGAREPKQATWYIKRLIGLVYISAIVIGAILYFSIDHLVALFGLSQEAFDLSVKISQTLFIVNAFLWPVAFTLPHSLRASGDVRFTMVVSFIGMWTGRIGGSYLLVRGFGLGIEGVWYAMYIDWLIRAVSFVLRFRSGAWKTKRVV